MDMYVATIPACNSERERERERERPLSGTIWASDMHFSFSNSMRYRYTYNVMQVGR